VHLQIDRGTDHSRCFLRGKILCALTTQRHRNQVESELEMGVVCTDLNDYIKNIKKLSKKKMALLSYLSFICSKCSKQLL